MAWRILREYVGYGLLLLVLMFGVLFILSLVFSFGGGEWPAMVPMALLAITLGGAAYVLLRRINPASRRQALLHTSAWASIVAGVTLIITIPNGTTAVIFGAWYDYAVYAAIIGAAFLLPGRPAQPPRAMQAG